QQQQQPQSQDVESGSHCEVDDEALLTRLSQKHAELGAKLSGLLRVKAEEEKNDKQLKDELVKSKARIKEIERMLNEE
ncbi:hypothetical protein BGZ65_011949, partial [Modicella reniformis]